MIFKDKTVIITGGSEGVGAATARLFADAGANLMLVARGKRNLEAIADELRGKTRVELFAMDVADADACVDVFKKAQFEFGRVDILINNAGFHERGPAESIQPADLGKMVDVNLRAPIILTRIALPYLREAGGGAIVNVGSLAGRTPVPGSATYAATKAGLRSFTYSLYEELRGRDNAAPFTRDEARAVNSQLRAEMTEGSRMASATPNTPATSEARRPQPKSSSSFIWGRSHF